jgi:hypothetical protein
MTARSDVQTSFPPQLAVTSWEHLARSPYSLVQLIYEPLPDEVRFRAALDEFLNAELTGDVTATTRGVLRRQCESSVFSVEPTLLQWLDELQDKSAATSPAPDADDAESDEQPVIPALAWRDRDAAAQHLRDLLSMLDTVLSDAKLQALLQFVKYHLAQPGNAVCVVTLYARTALYLHSALGDIGIAAVRATGELPDSERFQAIQDFQSRGAVLVTTYSALRGIEVSNTTLAVLYDRLTPEATEQVIGRFNRYGRQVPLTVVKVSEKSDEPHGG